PNITRIAYGEAVDIVTRMKDTVPLNLAMLTLSSRARVYFNKVIFGDVPMQGHVVTCLKNDWDKGVCNGQRGIVESVGAISNQPWIPMMINFRDENLRQDRKSTRLNSSHVKISYAVFCLKKNKQIL